MYTFDQLTEKPEQWKYSMDDSNAEIQLFSLCCFTTVYQ